MSVLPAVLHAESKQVLKDPDGLCMLGAGSIAQRCGATARMRAQPHWGGPHTRAVEGDQQRDEAEAALPLLRHGLPGEFIRSAHRPLSAVQP